MTVVVAETEALLGAILRNFEALALRQYEVAAPEAATQEKRDLVARLRALAPDDALLARSDLDVRVQALVERLTSNDRRAVLVNQGFLLEFVGKAIYASVGVVSHISEELREICALGLAASDKSRAAIMEMLRKEFPKGEDFLCALIELSPDVLKQLDPLSEELDRNFGATLGLRFGDLIGDFVSEVDDAAAELGADRRKLVAFLTHIMMEM